MTDPEVHPTDAQAPSSPIDATGSMQGRGCRMITVALVILLVASLAAAGILAKSRSDERRRADRLSHRLATVEKELGDLRGRTSSSGGDLGDLLGGDLGDLLGGDLADLLGGLLGGDLGNLGDLSGLLGDDAASMLECMGGAGGLGGLLGGGGGPAGGADIPDDNLDAQYDGVADWVAGERDLEFDTVPEPRYVTSEEIARLVEKEIRREYPEQTARLDSDLLSALGAVDPGTDMADVQVDLIGSQVAGFYDPRTGDLVVATDDPSEPLTGFAVIAVAHELDHALTDQALHLPIDVDEMTGASDAQMAATALVEGDATMLMYRFSASALSLPDQMGMGLDPSALAAQKALADTPAYLAAQLQFPYLDGLMFTCGLQADGGWSAVDDAYADPPSTTAQILFPERYASGEGAVDAPDPSSPRGSWEQERARTLGAADLYWLFQAPGDDTSAALDDPLGRAAGWAGGEAVQWARGDSAAVGLSFVQHSGEADLCDSVTQWYRAAFPEAADSDIDGGLAFEGDEQTAVLRCDGNNVRLGIAPDLTTATTIAN